MRAFELQQRLDLGSQHLFLGSRQQLVLPRPLHDRKEDSAPGHRHRQRGSDEWPVIKQDHYRASVLATGVKLDIYCVM